MGPYFLCLLVFERNDVLCYQIVENLEKIGEEFQSGKFVFKESDEDIHTAVERRLTELIGDPAKKLHTGEFGGEKRDRVLERKKEREQERECV